MEEAVSASELVTAQGLELVSVPEWELGSEMAMVRVLMAQAMATAHLATNCSIHRSPQTAQRAMRAIRLAKPRG